MYASFCGVSPLAPFLGYDKIFIDRRRFNPTPPMTDQGPGYPKISYWLCAPAANGGKWEGLQFPSHFPVASRPFCPPPPTADQGVAQKNSHWLCAPAANGGKWEGVAIPFPFPHGLASQHRGAYCQAGDYTCCGNRHTMKKDRGAVRL